MKLRVRLACGGTSVRLHGTLDPSTATISGHFVAVQHGEVRGGTFTLTKQAG